MASFIQQYFMCKSNCSKAKEARRFCSLGNDCAKPWQLAPNSPTHAAALTEKLADRDDDAPRAQPATYTCCSDKMEMFWLKSYDRYDIIEVRRGGYHVTASFSLSGASSNSPPPETTARRGRCGANLKVCSCFILRAGRPDTLYY